MSKQYIRVSDIIYKAKTYSCAVATGLIFTLFSCSDDINMERTYTLSNPDKQVAITGSSEINIRDGRCLFSINENSEKFDYVNYRNTMDSFNTSFNSVCDNKEAMPVFHNIVSKLAVLPIKEGYADYGKTDENIHFNMFISDDLRLSIDKPMSTKNDNIVAFAIYVERELLVMDYDDVSSLVEKVQKLMA